MINRNLQKASLVCGVFLAMSGIAPVASAASVSSTSSASSVSSTSSASSVNPGGGGY